MRKGLLKQIEKLNKSRRQRKWWQRVVRTMAMVVVFCTTYALILPAITMERDVICGLEAHVHEDNCYSQQHTVSFQCGLEDQVAVVHSHDALCFDGQNQLICPLTELAEHIHEDSCRKLVAVCVPDHVCSEDCVTTKQVLICDEEEREGHTHSEACASVKQVLICAAEEPEHVHEEACYEEQTVPCSLIEGEGHVHGSDCYEEQEVPCELIPAQPHEHSGDCYQMDDELNCGREEVVCHLHEENCYDSTGTLTCTRPVVLKHTHTEDCLLASGETQRVLSCGMEEHTHVDSCYPLEEEDNSQSEFFCGSGIHAHVETCYDEAGALICTIPEHSHDALCMIKNLDLTADVETAQEWEKAFDGLVLSGNWAEDLLTVAKTQLNYQESKQNLACIDGVPQGYTRYGAKYDTPYSDWSALFVRFCLDYAKVENISLEDECEESITSLKEQQLFADTEVYTPAAGDLIFLDMDDDEYDRADHMGIVEETMTETGEVRIIAGNAQKGIVDYETYLLTDEAIVGFVKLPENPNYEEQATEVEKLNALLASLPEAKQAKTELLLMNQSLDQDRYDTYLQLVTLHVEEAKAAYEDLGEEQKSQIIGYERVPQLEAVCAEAVWQQLPVLTEDDAVVSALNARHLDNTVEEEPTVKNGETAFFGFCGETQSYTETAYGEARVRLEFVLPVGRKKASFDMDAMLWLEEPVLTQEIRTIDGTEVLCQILTGYKRLSAETLDKPVIPGSFAENAAVKLLDMAHGEKLNIRIRAAFEQSAWDGQCMSHGLEESLSIQSKTVKIFSPVSPEEQQAAYESFLAEYDILLGLDSEAQAGAAAELQARISESYLSGSLSDEAFSELSEKVCTLIYGDLNSVAEPCVGSNWQILRDSGWFEAYEGASGQSAEITAFSTMRSAASSPLMMAAGTSAVTASDQQIRAEGGYNTSQEGAVYVGKTIAGTEQENVFDITLDVITQDIVTEVYKEPDMAVVIVMDISNTMKSNFGGVTRYSAAMTAAENFLDQFAANNLGASKVGFVAFNTDAHQIFKMSSCSTTAQATTLKSTMRTKTGNIINASDYADSAKRFTNIEAGLKRAYDLLDTVDNEHKYIVFLSDGFPTTYIQSGYVGYDTYDSAGTRFYDSVELYNKKKRPCSYGTSYSDEAAIRARKMATTLKNNGTTIFSVGVDVGGQTIKYYVDAFKGSSFSVVDRRNTNYEIGSASDTNAFKNWLGHSIGSGDGYYFDSTNSSGLSSAFNTIFQRIKEMNAASSHLDWVASDPMPDMGVHELETMEFIGFFDRDGNLVEGDLKGQSGDGWQYENTASFDTAQSTIHWDLKNSGYVSSTAGNKTNYECRLTYRVRLKNENMGFTEFNAYDTNDVTSLTYRVIDKSGDEVTISEQRTVNYPIPAVEGYLADLSFDKVDSYGKPVIGAEFTLVHDTDASDGMACAYCRGDGRSYVSIDSMVAASDSNGRVSFTNIRSGHTYTLTETLVPEGYKENGNSYQITVAYDTLTVSVTDMDGNPLTWEAFIENTTSYMLPETGGSGTFLFTFGGLLMIAAACVYFVIQIERKYRRGGVYRKS